ncbi:hypothetical protein CXG81DRAFT_9414 [Caulochytrium protostelioides]|uniref:ATP11-domain-containing protein n=1 Tax=Caulochytrium protostelioides TaxID=1555241 RepID=A0A4P9XEJ8_9FUNG|nr:ATP11-domain-containing protein [Caulochytrium protostelioides]RKP03581.1 hypothetical protein CXG81DRAFT_9414 [Caulochytrium protostelioides]|eukprot:RKP03581.1 hypothetical protein CXG81DRAFT_9414 [Caulochytrium protostelioides]
MAAYQAEDAAAAAAAAAAASPEVLAAPSEQATPSEQTTTTTAAAAKPSPARPRAFRDPPTTPTLSTVMNVEKLGPLTAEQVGALWNGYHARKALSLSGVMPSDFWARLAARAARCPTFVLPLPRDGGWEFVLMEWQGRVLSFTPLVEYKAHGAAARPHLVVTHFTELAQDKGLVLMAGEITPCPKAAAEALLASPPGSDPVAAAARPPTGLLTPAEAQNLVYQMQEFYVTGSDTKRALVQTFHEDPARFAYHQVIEAVEKLDDGDITAALDAAPSAAGASAAPSAATKA